MKTIRFQVRKVLDLARSLPTHFEYPSQTDLPSLLYLEWNPREALEVGNGIVYPKLQDHVGALQDAGALLDVLFRPPSLEKTPQEVLDPALVVVWSEGILPEALEVANAVCHQCQDQIETDPCCPETTRLIVFEDCGARPLVIS